MHRPKLKLVIAYMAMLLGTSACTQEDMETAESRWNATPSANADESPATAQGQASRRETGASNEATGARRQPPAERPRLDEDSDSTQGDEGRCDHLDSEVGCALPPVDDEPSQSPSEKCEPNGGECEPEPPHPDDCGPDEDGCGPLPPCAPGDPDCENPAPEECGPDEDGCGPLPPCAPGDPECENPSPEECGPDEDGCGPLPPCAPGDPDCEHPTREECGPDEDGCVAPPSCASSESGCGPIPGPPSEEECDGLDNDHDGAVDEAIGCDHGLSVGPPPFGPDYIATDCSEFEGSRDDSPNADEVCDSVGLAAGGDECWTAAEPVAFEDGQSGALPPTLNENCIMVQYCIAEDFTDAFACLRLNTGGEAEGQSAE